MLKNFAIARYLVLWEIAIVVFLTLTYSYSVSSETTFSSSNSSSDKPHSLPVSVETQRSCPSDLSELTNLLIQDLPNYSNRVIQRTQDSHQDAGIDNYIVAAGQPELEPLNLPQINYGSTMSETTEQIFFTTLERQYSNQQKIERETYHWLFVTLTESGWHLVTMYSRFGHATKNTLPTPPTESSNGIIGQAVSLWLRDCRESLALR
ncbi:conserved hypothetical protein [Hyella patelloides LEGE 07179]|uniref:Uncharacterized protein n=1 Tax=Hyella patelloides LEGE 07179 TaxID=945734 RepID=A0A563VU16_9CYAN|nr:hypothetical protein [Hyella patelloides]VEP14869.1 conserved hypothetical protein [Hyella patelloides LEGE 07179]